MSDRPVASLDVLLERARRLLERAEGRRVVLGVVGAPGAGKSTLVDLLLARLRAEIGDAVAHLPMDGFHLADAQLDRLGRRRRKGAPDTFDATGLAAALRRCRDEPGRTVYVPGFERDLEQPIAAALAVAPEARLVLTEGNYLLLGADASALGEEAAGWAEVGPLIDESWFVEVDDALRRERLVARHVRFGKTPAAAVAWVEAVDEPNAHRVSATAGRADLRVDLEAVTAP